MVRHSAAVTPELDPARVAHFRILGRLGHGGMGVVYRAEDEDLRRMVALKLLPETSGSEERRQRFLREARSAAAITHPNVAVVYQVGQADGRVYIAMELVEGENLRARLDRGRLEVATAIELAGQIARGLSAAHDKGIVHRDLKPENVMITPAGVVKLLDFGLAKAVIDARAGGDSDAAMAETETVVTSDEGRVMGTPEYMSPEQAMGEPLDVRSDVFSLGVVLYEMLSGARPFAGASTGAVLVAIARDTPARLRERAPDVDEATDALVMRCLAKAPGDRFASAGEIVAALSGQRSAKATTESRTEVAPITRSEDMRRRPLAVRVGVGAAMVVGALLVLGFLGLAWREGIRPRAATNGSPTAVPVEASAPRGHAITDRPPPKTNNPEAAAAFAAAMQDLRDASLSVSGSDLQRATKLDPTFAAAHLANVMREMYAGDALSPESFAAATQFRSALDDRDQMLLRAAEPLRLDPPDFGEVADRLRAVSQRFANDAEVLFYLGGALLHAGQTSEAHEALERAVTVDPQFAAPVWLLAGEQMGVGNLELSQHLNERCLAISPSAASCLRQQGFIHLRVGRCADFEADTHRLTVIEPNGSRSYLYLAIAIASRGAQPEGIRAALEKWMALEVAVDATYESKARNRIDLGMTALTGDLAAATDAARQRDGLLGSNMGERAHAAAALAQVAFLEEQGAPAKALAVAEAFERRIPGWTADAPGGVRLYLAYARHRSGRLTDAQFAQTRSALMQEVTKGEPPAEVPLDVRDLYAVNAEKPDEVAETLALFDKPPPPRTSAPVDLQSRLGRAYLLAGRTDEALPWLRRAATQCAFLGEIDGDDFTAPVDYMHAHLWLGQALEAKGDKGGACEAYGVILSRWKNAKPRSVTLDKAKERSRALGCSP